MSNSQYIDFLLNSNSDIIEFETIQISHSSFPTVSIVRNKIDGLTAILETDQEAEFQFYNILISPPNVFNDLDFSITIEIGDLGEVVPGLIDLIQTNNAFSEKPEIVYRTYRSDNLDIPMLGPLSFQVNAIETNGVYAVVEAGAFRLNNNKTGTFYRVLDFPTLEVFQ